MKHILEKAFKDIFNRNDGISFFSPGRVNLIGEHIDYNGGFVFPCALSYGTYGIVQKRDDNIFNVYSVPFSKKAYQFSLNSIKKDPNYEWANYIKGSLDALIKHGYHIPFGCDIYMVGTMPFGAGLSSSASLEMLIIVMMNHIFNLNISKQEMALLGKYAENMFVGVNSGIMDQFAVIASKKDYAIMLNTDTLTYEHVPLILKDDVLLIVNTSKKRGLADSKYNERFNECQTSLAMLKEHFKIKHLCELTTDQLDTIKDLLHDDILYKRVKHVITEQDRTIRSKKALNEGDISTFASLMSESHTSLKDDYEVTGIELDTMQQLLLDAGAKGARMTGAGFGGCVVAIIPNDIYAYVLNQVAIGYEKTIGYAPSFYTVTPSEGTHIL